MSKTQAKNLGSEMARTQKTLQLEVIERFLSKSEVQALIAGYRGAVKGTGSRNRFVALNREVTENEKELLRAFFNENITTQELEEKYGLKKGVIYTKVETITKRLVYQNQKALNL